MLMKKLFIITLYVIYVSTACTNKHEHKPETSSDSIKVEKPNYIVNKTYDLYFLGHYIRCSEDSLYSEMEHLYANDADILFDKQTGNIDICGILFHVNPNGGGLVLMSSVQPETKGINKVRKYINKFHGEENYVEPDHYFWLPYTDSTLIEKNYPIIHLRRVHSDEGGTAILVHKHNYEHVVKSH